MNEKKGISFSEFFFHFFFSGRVSLSKLAPEMKWKENKRIAPKCKDVESKENRKQISLWVVCGAVVYPAQPILAIT
jgi:hypothetical protein